MSTLVARIEDEEIVKWVKIKAVEEGKGYSRMVMELLRKQMEIEKGDGK